MAVCSPARAVALVAAAFGAWLLLQVFVFSWDSAKEAAAALPPRESIAGHDSAAAVAAAAAGASAGASAVAEGVGRGAPAAAAGSLRAAGAGPSRREGPSDSASTTALLKRGPPAAAEAAAAAPRDDRPPCGTDLAGRLTTVRLASRVTATYCASLSQPLADTASGADLTVPVVPHFPTAADADGGGGGGGGSGAGAARPLFVGVTSPCGNLGFRAKRRDEFLTTAAGFPTDARYLFFVGLCGGDGAPGQGPGGDDNALIRAETIARGDVVQLGFHDTFHNLTLKSLSVMEFGVRMAAGDTGGALQHILKVEDYMRNSWDDVRAVAAEQRAATEAAAGARLYYGGGAIFHGGKIFRRGRWGCPTKHCPEEKFPTKYAGGMYMLSTAAAALLSGAMDTDPRLDIVDPYPIEDHFIASYIAEKVPVEREKRLWWKGGSPYNAPHTEAGDYLLQRKWQDVDGSQHPGDGAER